MSLRSASNGNVATRGARSSSATRSSPAFWAATRIAPSVVSPRIRQSERADRVRGKEAGITAQGSDSQHLARGLGVGDLAVWGVPDAGDRHGGARTPTRPATVISALVSVPVLSVQMTVVDPGPSTAVSRLISAWRRAMRRTAIASETDIVAGSPSGTRATMTPSAKTNDPNDGVAGQGPQCEQAPSRPDRDAAPAGPSPRPRAAAGSPPRNLCRQAVDPAELGLQPGREHDGLAAAVDDGRAHEHAVACVGDLDLRALPPPSGRTAGSHRSGPPSLPAVHARR